MAYHEQFSSGDENDGAYQCLLTLSAPTGWTLAPGGPATAFVAPAARDHGGPGAATLERETAGEVSPLKTNDLSTNNSAAAQLSERLAAMLGTTIQIEDLPPFVERVTADLHLIYRTPSGKELLDSLHASGKRVNIDYSMGANDIADYELPDERFFKNKDAGIRGAGTGSSIGYNPALETIGIEPWATRPPAIALAHELIHAEQAAYGRMTRGRAPNGPPSAIVGLTKADEADIRELEAVGVPPHDTYTVNENKIRREWDPRQRERIFY